MSLLDPKITELVPLSVRARMIVEGALSGLHRARSRGSSVEFAEHKEYSPGDEVRHIDWRMYAKSDRYFVRQYEREAELTAYLVLDASASMLYGHNQITKLSHAAELLASVAYLLIRQRDRVGLFSFGGQRLAFELQPKARPAHLQQLLASLEEIAGQTDADGTTPSTALARIAERIRRRRSMILFASDLFDRDGSAIHILSQLAANGHDVVLFHVLHPDEIKLPFSGLTEFVDLEQPASLLTNAGAVRSHYQRALSKFLTQVSDDCLAHGITLVRSPAGSNPQQTLLRFLLRRQYSSATSKETGWDSLLRSC